MGPNKIIEEEISTAGAVIDAIDKALGRVDSFLKALDNNRAPQVNERHHKIGVKVRLQKIELLKYNGDPKMFKAFFDSFKSVIHNNHDLSDRFSYSKTQLIGPATSAIAGLPYTGDNYHVTMEIVRERFGTKAVVISSHMDTRALRRIHDKAET